MFEECRQKVKLLRSGKRAHGADSRIFFPGTVVDRVVRDWLLESPGDLGRMPTMVEAIMEREEELLISNENRVVKWKDSKDKAQVLADCAEAVTRIEPALMKYVVPYEYMVDYRFRTKLTVPVHGIPTELLLIGAMDILVRNPAADWWMVLDVKMTKDDGYWKKTQGQLSFYDLQVELEQGKPTIACALLQPMCKEQVKVVAMTEERRTELLSHIVTFATAMHDDNLPVTEKIKQCLYCDFKHACPKFAPVINAQGKKTLAF